MRAIPTTPFPLQVFNMHFNKLECVYTCLTQLYVGRDMYNLLHKIHYMFRPFSLAIFRLIIEKHLVSSYT